MKLIPKGQSVLFINQYGDKIWARSLKELRTLANGGKVAKQYCDDKQGKTWHTGYIIGEQWFTAYLPLRVEAD